MATACARLAFLSGFPVVVLERAQPLAVRRLVSFASAVPGSAVEVEGVTARHVPAALASHEFVAVVVDEEGACLSALRPAVLLDARMRKAPAEPAPAGAFAIGLGPGFVAGGDVHAVIETQRGADLGRVVWSGAAEADTAVPAPVLGHTVARVLRAPSAGVFTGAARIGDLVEAGALLGDVGGVGVRARIGGLVRGLVADGVTVRESEKLGDIDPRGAQVDPARISEKARAVSAGALEAILVGLGKRG